MFQCSAVLKGLVQWAIDVEAHAAHGWMTNTKKKQFTRHKGGNIIEHTKNTLTNVGLLQQTTAVLRLRIGVRVTRKITHTPPG